QPDALEVPELSVERLANQRMGEAVTRDRAGHLADDAGSECLLEDFEDPLLVEVAHALEHVEPELLPDDGGEREQLRARVAQAGKPAPDDLADAVGKADLARLDPAHPLITLAIRDALVEEVAQNLHDEE